MNILLGSLLIALCISLIWGIVDNMKAGKFIQGSGDRDEE